MKWIHISVSQKTTALTDTLGVLQELYALLMAHYCVRTVMHRAALQVGLSPLRLSFTKSLRILRQAVFEFQVVCESQFAGLHKRLLNDIAQAQLPERVHRSNPRVVKRKMSDLEKKRQKHRTWPQPTKPFSEAGALLI